MTRLRHLGRPRAGTGPDTEGEDGTAAERAGSGADPGSGTDSGAVTGSTGTADGTDTDGTGTDGTGTGTGSTGAVGATEVSPDGPSPARGDGRRPRAYLGRLVPAAAAALLVLAGGGFFYGAHQLRSTPSAENRSLTDAEATSRVAGDVGNALARVFSYTPDGLAATERTARSVLAGRAERQYTELMSRIRADLAKQSVTLSTQAVRTGVIELDGDSARLLVFLDQITHRGKAGTTSAAAQLTVTARRQGDQWRIVDIRSR
jgi:Mce-associated membrane protein